MANFFSRPAPAHTQRRFVPHAQPPAEETSAPSPQEVQVKAWRDELLVLTTVDGDEQAPRLTIAQAHPGGLAQLFADHTTRLSNLVREPVSYRRAVERANAVIARSAELTARHGVGTIHLAIGRAQWRHEGTRITSPAFLRPLLIEQAEDDILLTLRPGACLAPALDSALESLGIRIDLPALWRAARTVHGFSSTKALAALKEAAGGLEAFELRDDLVLGIFEHPAGNLLRELDNPQLLLTSPLVRALAGDEEETSTLLAALPEPDPRDRDPWKEKGAGDLTPRQQDVIEAIAQGRSLLVDVPSGADGATILGALLAEAASRGRTTLHIGGSPSRTARAEARLRDLGLDEIAVRIDGTAQCTEQMRDRISGALADTSQVADSARVDAMRHRLVAVREILSGHTAQLHKPFETFGISAFDALQVLTDLTGTHPNPRTKVRLRKEVLLDVASDQGERARTLLHRASTLGLFSRSNEHAAWTGVVINAPEQVPEVLTRINRLSEDTLPRLRTHMSVVAAQTGIRPAASLEQWEAQLTMFEGVRDVLDIFQPRVFERSAADMVFATASRQWRKDHGIAMRRSQRVRLVKQARDLLRPGIHVKDLHRELLIVQDKRDLWRRHCDADGWPTLPQHLEEITEVTRSVRADLDRLAPVFATAHPDLTRMAVIDLARLLERLAADPEGAHDLPKRVAVLKALADLGLEDLTKDLRRRHVSDDQIDAELDLAWWASVLGQMIASEPRLGGFDPLHLQAALEEGRALDREQVESLSPQVIDRVRRLRRSALATYPDEHTDLLTALGTSMPAADLYAQHSLVRALVPVALTVPTLVPWILPNPSRVDLLVLDDIDSLPLAELVPIIARADQVVVLADKSAASEDGAVAQLAGVLPTLRLEVAPSRLNDQVALLLARHGIGHTGVPIPWTAANAPVTAIWTDGSGMPAPGATAVESTSQEVSEVVDLVLAHAVEQPERTLAVIALNPRHAHRIRTSVDRAIAAEPGVASFFDGAVIEPFVVVDPEGARGLSRDRVIISVGFAKTPHGRVLHDFGEISTQAGVSLMAGVLASVRGDLTLVSSLMAGDIDPARITTQGAQMLVDLLEIAEGQSGQGSGAWPTLQAAPDRLLIDLAERLYGMGLEVVPNVGIPGGLRIPLAIGHPEVPGRLLVAVLTDDEAYVAEPSQRMRDRVLPAMLEAQGWKVHTALSMPVFIDPGKEADAIVHLVLDAVDEVNGPHVPPVEVPVLSEEGTDPEEVLVQVGLEAATEVEEAAIERGNAERIRRDDLGVEVQALRVEERSADSVSSPIDEGGAGGPVQGDTPQRGPRPAIAQGLPLAAYGDDQLDELAQWVRSDGVERSHEELVEHLREALGLTRRGAQSDAVLGNVVRRTGRIARAVQDTSPSDNPEEGSV